MMILLCSYISTDKNTFSLVNEGSRIHIESALRGTKRKGNPKPLAFEAFRRCRGENVLSRTLLSGRDSARGEKLKDKFWRPCGELCFHLSHVHR